ncbi:sentrin-specific protease 5-like isoform X2 [Rhinatrema bivittatum]|uniref:sentrin-specific protease 5-like isoform X2 n=1 Tax=Rhinatrema bivittatum TaxID=194408 RepID=UPI001127DCE1|nr:sentrin-specific protease 5-like isoform X2 [Rhinatrema bivittatum]
MKEHRKTLYQKRSALLAPSKKWMTGNGGLRKYCFQQRLWFVLTKKKRHSGKSAVIWKKSRSCRRSQCRWKVYLLRTKRRNTRVHLCARKRQQLIVRNSAFPKKPQRKRTFLPFSSKRVFLKDKARNWSVIATEESDLAGSWCTEQEPLDKVTQLQTVILGPRKDCGQCIAILPVKRKRRTLISEDDVDNLAILHTKKKKCCQSSKRYSICARSCFKKSSKFSRCSRKGVLLFMMYKKLSSIRFWHWMLNQKKFRARSRRFKSKNVTLTWVQKVTRDCPENCRKFKKEVCSLFCLESKINNIGGNWCISSNMNNNISAASELVGGNKMCASGSCCRGDAVKLQGNEGHFEETVPSNQNIKNCQQLDKPALHWDGAAALAREEVDQAPAVNSCHELCVSVTGKEIVVSGQKDAEQNQVTCGDEVMLLESSKVALIMNDHVSGSGPVLMEPVHLSNTSCQMEVAGTTHSDVFSTELLDHPYCKSPFEAPSSESIKGKLDKQKGRVKNGQKIISRVPDEQLASCISGFLTEVVKKYGSLIPLCEKDVLARLKEVFNEDFSGRKSFVTKEITRYRTKHSKTSVCNFQVFYNKHMLDMDDLATLDGQNWLNDQVHFFNSFFHRQLVTKGYNGVKRWTKKVDLFKKSLLLIPIHLEVHWSLITVNIPDRIISFYDSQGIHFKFCVENIRKYLLTEAREKNHPEFLQGWQTAVTKCIPQQKNDSDCGVFVLQYCKCLALDQPFQFSQDDMPRVRKRIYKELCECRLTD